MQLTNKEIIMVNNALGEIFNIPMRGLLKFKVARNKRALEEITLDILEATDNLESEDAEEVLEETVEVEIQPLMEMELADVEISPSTIILLDPIIEEETNND